MVTRENSRRPAPKPDTRAIPPVVCAGIEAEPSAPAGPQAILGDRFEEALAFAARTHRTQVSKGSHIPYVSHLLGVRSLVIEDDGSEDEAIGALLHDAAEDRGGERMLAEIRTRFGDHVADIVAACSDTFETPKPPWQTRKQTYIDHLAGQPESVLRVSLADKLFNARAILRDYLLVGDAVWDRFKAGRDGSSGTTASSPTASAGFCPDAWRPSWPGSSTSSSRSPSRRPGREGNSRPDHHAARVLYGRREAGDGHEFVTVCDRSERDIRTSPT